MIKSHARIPGQLNHKPTSFKIPIPQDEKQRLAALDHYDILNTPPDETPTMKHSHHHDNLRSAGLQLKRERSESTRPATRTVPGARTSDDSQPEVETFRPTGNGQGPETLSDQERLDLRQAAERNKDFTNPIQSFWPTPSA